MVGLIVPRGLFFRGYLDHFVLKRVLMCVNTPLLVNNLALGAAWEGDHTPR
jgi:hypothetical protein